MTQTAGALGRPRFFVWTGIILLVLYLVLAGGGGTAGTYVPAFRIATLLALVAVIGIWTLHAWRRPDRRPATTMWPAVIAIFTAFFVSTATSWNLRVSVEFLGYSVLLLTLYLILVLILRDPALAPRMLSLAALLSGAVAVIYLWRIVSLWITWWGAVGRITTPPLRPGFEGLSYGNPSAVAAIAVLLLAPSTVWLAGRGQKGRVAIAVLLALVGATVLTTGSRGAWLGLALGVTLTGTWYMLKRGRWRTVVDRTRHLSRRGTGVIVTLLALATIAGVVLGPAILSRLLAGGDSLRFALSLTALRMFADDPLTGSGPGTWVVRRPAFTEPQELDYYIPHAHNVFTQGLAEFGLVGIVAGLVVAALVVRLLLRAIGDEAGDRRRMAWAAIFVLAYFFGHQLVDSYMNLPALLFAAVVPIAYLDARALNASTQSVPSRGGSMGTAVSRGGLITIALACAVSIGWLLRIEFAAATSLTASVAAIDGDGARAARLSREALSGDPDLPAYWFLTALATATESPSTALELIRRSARTDDFAQAWLNVAAMEFASGNHRAAENALSSAMRLGWRQPAISFPAGTLYLRLGDEESAIDALALAVWIAPHLIDDPAWQAEGLTAVREPSIERAIAMAEPVTASVIALFAGRSEEAREFAQQLPRDEREITTFAIGAWDGDPSARAGLLDLAEANPLDNRPVTWLALLATRDGDNTARDRFLTWAGITGGSFGVAIGSDVVVTDTPWNRRQVPGPNANFQGLYIYRRLYPWDLLVPGLPKLTLE